MARVASLMLPYFEKDTAQVVRKMELEDWSKALGEFPKWAINDAVFWWKSDDNKNRRKIPLHGDIVARVKIEMGAVRAANIKLKASNDPPRTDFPVIPEYTKPTDGPSRAERANRIMQEGGFTPKRMPR